jgi:hypothetical protein
MGPIIPIFLFCHPFAGVEEKRNSKEETVCE